MIDPYQFYKTQRQLSNQFYITGLSQIFNLCNRGTLGPGLGDLGIK
jgi:hypothetical protein